MKRQKLLCAMSSLTIAVYVPGFSAAATGYGMEEVVITARKREENLQQTPISVTAISGDLIDSAGLSDITSIESVTPNLNFTVGTGGGSSTVNAFIRGVGEFDFLLTKDPAVGLYIDGVYMARTFGANMELADIERIEVLRGPQGTLFGKNAIGGAINVVTRKPGDEFNYEVELSAGDYGFRGAKAYLELPLADTLSAGVSLIGKHSDGWQERPGGDAGDDGVFAGRINLNWLPTDDFESLLSVDTVHQDQNGYPNTMLTWNPGAIFALLQNTLLDPCCTPNKDIDRSGAASSELLHDDLDGTGVNWTNTWSLRSVTLKSITGYREMEALFGRDGDNSALDYAGDVHDESHRQFSQEIQLSGIAIDDRLEWTAGLYYFTENTTDNTTLVTARGLHDALAALPTPLLFPGEAVAFDLVVDFDNHQQGDSYAAYMHSSYAINEQWTISAGARYTQEMKRFDQSARRVASGAPLLAPDFAAANPFATPGQACSDIDLDGSFQCEETWSEFSPKLGLDYLLNDDVMLYGHFSRGFRSGGFNGRPTSLGEVAEYDPETLTSYELGFKSRWLENRLRVNGALFLNKYRDQQVVVLSATPTGVSAITRNAGRSTMQGLELEMVAMPTTNLELMAGLSYLDAQYDRWRDDTGDHSDRDFEYAPDWTASVAAQYTWRLDGGGRLALRGDGAYKGQTYLNATNSEFLHPGGHTVWNAAARYFSANEHWEVALQGKNLTNKRVLNAGFDAVDAFGFAEGSYNPPRQVVLSVRYRTN